MLRKTMLIAFNEARMSCRGWRFWLLLGLVAGISLFARRDYLLRAQNGFFLHSAFSFQHPSFWLMIAILALGACALALDICGRLRHSRMDKILFPLPIGVTSLMCGRLLGVLIVMVPLSLIGIFSFGLWQYLYGHGVIIWRPFWVAFVLLVLPVIVPAAALAITMRTFFKHDFAALIIGGLIGTLVYQLGVHEGILINVPEVIRYLANSSSTIGVRLSFEKYWMQSLMHALLSVTFLSLAPLYLRRQEPQRWIIKRNRNKFLSISLLMRAITNLRFDRHLGWGYRLLLAFTLLVSASSVIWATYSYKDFLINSNNQAETTVRVRFPSITVDLQKYEFDLKPNKACNRLDIQAVLIFTPKESTKYLGVELDPRYTVDDAALNDQECSFANQQNRVRFNFHEALTPEQEYRLTVNYHGAPVEFNKKYTAMHSKWYPVPWRKIETANERWIQVDEDLFESEITLHIEPGQTGAFAGDLIDVKEDNQSRTEHWSTIYPVDRLQMYWGNYELTESDSFGYKVRFYHFPMHEYKALIYMEEVKDQHEFVKDKLGRLPFNQLTLIETPYTWQTEYSRKKVRTPWAKPLAKPGTYSQSMPGMFLVSENHLCYISEEMWLMERFDHNPRLIPFYQLLPQTLREIHDTFYRNLISAYFDQSIHPTGEMAFWVNDYLSSYASKLLERNAWSRRRALCFDVGSSRNLPLSVAKSESLLSLHKMGTHPELERIRGEGLFRMLHHLLGEKTWWAFLREMFRRYRFQEIPVEELLPLLEEFYDEDLGWFIEEWVLGNALPQYEITYTEAKIVSDDKTGASTYKTLIRVKNHGSGRMSVPIYVETEMDYITRNIWLDAGDEKNLSINSPHRPIFAVVDPENWILQVPHLDKIKKKRMHSERRILIEGDDTTALRANNRRRHRHFWRH